MHVMARETWTDERLDDLKGRMDERFDQVEADMDRRFTHLETEMDHCFNRIEVDVRELRGIMVGGFVALLVALVGTSAI